MTNMQETNLQAPNVRLQGVSEDRKDNVCFLVVGEVLPEVKVQAVIGAERSNGRGRGPVADTAAVGEYILVAIDAGVEVPLLLPGGGIEREYLVEGRAAIERAVNQDGRHLPAGGRQGLLLAGSHLDARGARGAEITVAVLPGFLQLMHIVAIDLRGGRIVSPTRRGAIGRPVGNGAGVVERLLVVLVTGRQQRETDTRGNNPERSWHAGTL